MLSRKNKKINRKRTMTDKGYLVCLCFIVINICMLLLAEARLALEDLLKAESESSVVDSPLELKKLRNINLQDIKQTGPLNLLRGYLYGETGLTHNKRFLSSDIKAKYTCRIVTTIEEEPIRKIVEFSRTPAEDDGYGQTDMPTQDDVYRQKYHNALVDMFPSENGTVSIETSSTNAFLTFLRADSVRKHAHYILAALFLLSEGVPVPINFRINSENGKQELFLWKNSSGNDSYFCVMTRIFIYNHEKSTKKEIGQTQAEKIIKFFIQYQNRIAPEPNTFEAFKKGEFLDSLQFLIQTYIFEFLNTVEEANEFFKAVHTILKDLAELQNKESLKGKKTIMKVDSVFNRCFISAGSSQDEIRCFQLVKNMEIALQKTTKPTPFSYINDLPSGIEVPNYGHVLNKFCDDYFYHDDIETNVYILFSYLLYDRNTKKCSTDRINPKGHLGKFFQDFSIPVKGDSPESADVHYEWCKVVSDINWPCVRYCGRRNGLDSGIFSLLSLAADISGFYLEEKKEIEELDQKLDDSSMISDEFHNNLQESILKIFKNISFEKNVDIFCDNFRFGFNSRENLEVFGSITLKYTFDNIQYGLTLEVEPKKIQISLLQTIDPEYIVRILNMRSCLKKKNEFMYCLLTQYINGVLAGFKEKGHRLLQKDWVKQIVGNNPKTANEMLMLRKIDDTRYKNKLLIHILTTVNKENIKLTANSALARFVANIVVSSPLGRRDVQNRFLCTFQYMDPDRKWPYAGLEQININDEEFVVPMNIPIDIIKYLLDIGHQEMLLHALEVFFKKMPNYVGNFYLSCTLEILEQIFVCLFKDNSLVYGKKLIASIKNLKDAGLEGYITLAWFIFACNDNKRPLDFTLFLYNSINHTFLVPSKNIKISYTMPSVQTQEARIVVYFLERIEDTYKKQFENKDERMKFDIISNYFNNILKNACEEYADY